MCDSKQEGPGAREAACMLCRCVEADPDTCGDKLQKGGLCAHVFCMRCCVCGQSGATIMCCVEGCDRWFHLPCSKEGGCVNVYATPSALSTVHEQEVEVTPEPGTVCPICMEPVEDRKTFTTLVCPKCKMAWFHRDCIQVGALPQPPGTAGAQQQQSSRSRASLTLPVFALQGQAMRAGFSCLQCPLCRTVGNSLLKCSSWGSEFPSGLCSSAWPTSQEGASAVLFLALPQEPSPALFREPGLQLHAQLGKALEKELGHPGSPWGEGSRNSSAFHFSIRQPTWEDNDAFAELGERHGQCNARDCLYPGGREEAEEEGPWKLLLCSSCAAEGTHRRCSGLRNSTHRWECDTCAGLGTSSRGESELSGSRLARQSGLGSAHGFSESEAISPSSHTPVLVSPSLSLEMSSHSRRHHTARQQALPSSSLDTSSISRSRPTCSRSPDPEDRAHSRRAGLSRRRSRSRQQGRAQSPPVRSRSRRDRDSVTGPRAERPRQRETPARTSPRRSRSRQQDSEDQHLKATTSLGDRDSPQTAAMYDSKQEDPGAREPALLRLRPERGNHHVLCGGL
ncbi:LOW QUALITY PROTEIN: uncharacterized protein GJ701_010017 [Geothlypis trichas]